MIKQLQGVTLGTDPEFPMVNDKGFLVPPVYLRKKYDLEVVDFSDPKHPIFIEDDNEGVKIMEDGALFEMLIRPSSNPEDIFNRVQKGLMHLKKLGKRFDLKPLHSPIAKFDVEKFYLNTEDEEIKQCVIAGCDPDRDAINVNYESKIRDLTLWKKRGAGGHVHIGVPNMPNLHKNIIPAVQLLAVTVGNTATAMSPYVEEEKARMEVFGKPGRYRQQFYGEILGVEYRTPSNSWLLSKKSSNLIYKSAIKALELLANPRKGKEVLNKYLEDSVHAILTVDKEIASNILIDLKLL